jgi:EAL domain-containing protein (putative c-di-GMP-specific phosphodiesterase class I)
VERREHIQHQLRAALQDGRFRLVYQPQVRLADDRIVGLEALCRWSTEPIGAVSPDEFIPVVESQDLLDDYRQWLLNTLQRDTGALLIRYPQLELSLNFSLNEMMRPQWLDDMMAWLPRMPAGTAARLLVEVTEHTYAGSLGPVIERMTALQQQGLRFAVDDFGVGASEMARLQALPFDDIKLDKSWVQHLSKPDVQASVTALLEHARQHHLRVVAEGIETPDQAREVQALGIEVGQGYWFDKPQPLAHWLSLPERFV